MYGAIQELIIRQNTLMLEYNHEITQQYMELQVINQNFKAMRNNKSRFQGHEKRNSFFCLMLHLIVV